jgi:hypothetical protein
MDKNQLPFEQYMESIMWDMVQQVDQERTNQSQDSEFFPTHNDSVSQEDLVTASL